MTQRLVVDEAVAAACEERGQRGSDGEAGESAGEDEALQRLPATAESAPARCGRSEAESSSG